MKLSVQKAHNAYSVLKKRKKMIKERNLHIGEEINYKKFIELYHVYGKGMSEEDFARLFLDLNRTKWYFLQSGKTETTVILSLEFVSQEETEEIRQAIIERYGYVSNSALSYNEFKELYSLYGGRLSLKQFGEQVLQIAILRSIDDAHSDPNRVIYILRELSYDPDIVWMARKRVHELSGLHIGERITKEQFERLYDEYGYGLEEEIFAWKVLEMNIEQWKDLMSDKRIQKSTVLKNHIVNPKDIFELREKVIKQENLHIEDRISYKRFLTLYEKYGGILTETQFAEEILDINRRLPEIHEKWRKS